MSTRSATNPRTQNREYTGVARKSAASAKPARAAGSSVRVVPASAKERRRERDRGESLEGLSKEEKKARKRAQRAEEDRIYDVANYMMRADEDYNTRRSMFWKLCVGGIVFIVVSWVLLSYAAQTGGASTVLQIVTLVAAYAMIIGAFIYDFVRIRPIRNYYRTKAEGLSEARIAALLAEARKDEASKKKGGFLSKFRRKKEEAEPAPAPEPEPEPEPKPAAKKRPKKNHRSRR